MRVHLIVVAHSLADDLIRLFDATTSEVDLYHLFLHSSNQAVFEACQKLETERQPHVILYNYQQNRGLARSWNDGLYVAYHKRGADVALIANDDAVPAPGDVTKIAQAAMERRDHYLVNGMGFDVRDSAHRCVDLALAAVNPIALDTIGYFDENFFPIYWEDVDWYRRAALAGLPRYTHPDTNIVHMGSQSVNTSPELAAQNAETFSRNHAYYIQKWGGDAGHETYTIPFNDPAYSLKISAEDRAKPYGAHDRTDQEIVKL